MKAILFFLLPVILGACCLGNRKCKQENNFAVFRIVNSANEQNLVFGNSKIYDNDLIKFYSLTGTDTLFHHYQAGPGTSPASDSLLYVTFDFSKKETVFLKLNNVDTDTLLLTYSIIDGSPCCQDYSVINSFSHNKYLLVTANGLTTIRK